MGLCMLKFSPVVKRTTVQSNENTFLEKRTPKRADVWKGLIKRGKKGVDKSIEK